jgi:NSS family neurotransmitter:Na+ symporter
MNLPVFNTDFLSLMNTLWGDLALAIGAMLLCIFVGYVWKTSKALEEIRRGCDNFWLASFWSFSVKYLSPVLIIFFLLRFFGVI